jgi:hypothetical protein
MSGPDAPTGHAIAKARNNWHFGAYATTPSKRKRSRSEPAGGRAMSAMTSKLSVFFLTWQHIGNVLLQAAQLHDRANK